MIVALFVAATSMAQNGPKRVVKMPQKAGQTMLTTSGDKQQRPALQQQHGQLTTKAARALSRTRHSALPKMPWQQARAQRKVTIADRPDGDYRMYERSGDSYFYSSWFGVLENPVVGKLGELVFADDGKVYMNNPITQVIFNTWIEGTQQGSTLSFTLPQHVTTVDGEEIYVRMMAYDPDEGTYVSVEGESTLNLMIDAETGVVSSADEELVTGELIVGLVYDNGDWAGYGDWDITMTPFNDEPVKAPADLETAQYSVKADGFSGTIANVGFDGNDIYVQGIYPGLPEGWVKGTIEGDKAVFASKQFIGVDTENAILQYLISAEAETIFVEDPDWGDYEETWYYVSDDDIVFDYDAATKTLSGSNLFMVNAGMSAVSYVETYENCTMKPFVEVAATPMTPYDVSLYESGYDYYNMGYGWGTLEFTMPSNDEDGEYILPDKLSYAVYVRVNGEEKLYEFHSYDYYYLPEDVMSEIPYNFSDNWDFAVSGNIRYFYYYFVGPEAFGVQAIYRGGGEERRSEIAWVDAMDLGSEIQPEAATPDYPEVDPDNVGGSIAYGSYTGNESRLTFGEWKPQTYDVAIKIADEAVVGTYIEDVTVNLRTVRGLSNLKVWLSSQLRVEDGVNVPDLISVDVDMPTKTGDVTVALPKPYTIPAEGVYVGYSFTLSADAYSSRLAPVSVVDEVKPFGFYIHSTAGILKWLDLSEQSGYTSCINVTLGGSLIKENAVTVNDGQDVFVKAGEAANSTISFVNYGSKGISSLDIEYDFNGQTEPLHIDLDKAVKGFYGVTYDYVLQLPVISEAGTYPLTVRVVKVNGDDNEMGLTEANTDVFVLNTMPKHRALLEEYTGLWCGWCPRGFVALELLKEMYPDEFVTVSYHNSDPMEITQYFPSEVTGFPTAWVDRGMEVDPFYGLDEEGFGVLDVLQWRNDMFGVAALDVEALLNEETNTVDVDADVTFPFTSDNVSYSLEYILVEDGMTGTGSDWRQANYYAGETAYEPEMAFFAEAEGYVEGLVFNDVAVMQSEMGGIRESIPTAVVADEPVSHSYSFDLEWAVNTSYDPIIQDNTKLFVVALLINNETGEVANAIKVPVTVDLADGIKTVSDEARKVSSVQFFDLSGRQLPKSAKGAGIVRITYADGTTRTVKTVK